MQVHATARVIVWQEGKAYMPSPVLSDIAQQKGFQCCLWVELPEPIHLEVQQCVCHIIVHPCDVLDVNVHIVLHSKECEGTDQGHHCFTARGGLGHDMNYGHVVTMEEQALPF